MTAFTDWIGREEQRSDRVTDSAIARFHATIGGEDSADRTPPGFHWCLCTPDAPMEALQDDGHPKLGAFLPPVPLPRRMWAASDVAFLGPIRRNAIIDRVSTIASVTEKSGKTGDLVFVEVDHLTRADGKDAIRERQTLVYREAPTVAATLPATGSADLSGWPNTRGLVPDPPLLFRYSALTFNTHRIHYDLAYARDAEGYPELVVHGPLMATLLLDLAARELGADNIASCSLRALSPAYAGQPLHLAARPDGDSLALAAIGDDGRSVMEMRVRSTPA